MARRCAPRSIRLARSLALNALDRSPPSVFRDLLRQSALVRFASPLIAVLLLIGVWGPALSAGYLGVPQPQVLRIGATVGLLGVFAASWRRSEQLAVILCAGGGGSGHRGQRPHPASHGAGWCAARFWLGHVSDLRRGRRCAGAVCVAFRSCPAALRSRIATDCLTCRCS